MNPTKKSFMAPSTQKRLFQASVAIFSSLFLAVGCMDSLVKDAGFDLWCGDDLCKWQTEEGSVRRVATWHPSDYGVELVGRPVKLSQLIKPHGGPGPCLKFAIIANLQAEAEVSLELDFFNDGTPDYSESIPGVRWRRQEFLVHLPERVLDGGFTLSLHKKGAGTAIFAELSADFVDSCRGEPIELPLLPLGYPCWTNDECQNGACPTEDPRNAASTAGLYSCSECATDADCRNLGEVCGVLPAPDVDAGRSYRACILAGQKAAGALCASSAECSAGVCDLSTTRGWKLQTCGDCDADAACAGGALCGVTSEADGTVHRSCIVPASAPAGATCASSAECITDRCCDGFGMGVCQLDNGSCPGLSGL